MHSLADRPSAPTTATATPPRPRAVRVPPPPRLTAEQLDDLTPVVTLDLLLILLAGTAVGAALASFILPALLPDLTASLLGDAPKAYWYLSRASGVMAYLLFWFSCVMGLTITNRFARLWAGGPAVADLHQFASLLALALLVFHVVILLGDRYANYRLDQLLIPFTAAPHEPFWVGLGQVAAYLCIPVTFSFYVRRTIGVRVWRLIHYLSFAIFWLSVAHGLGAGTDSGSPVMLAMYIVTGCALVFLTVYRVVMATGRRASAPGGRIVV